jgi:hypothetical protein
VKPSVILARVPSAYLITPPGAFFQSYLICEEGACLYYGVRGSKTLIWYGTVDADNVMSGFRRLDLYNFRCLQSPDSIMTVFKGSKQNCNNVIFFLHPIGQRAHTSICTHFGLPPPPPSSPGLEYNFGTKSVKI